MQNRFFGMRVLVMLLCLGTALHRAQAEGHLYFGPEAHGINRVVRTKGDPVNRVNGFTGAKGTVAISYVMPTQFNAEANAQVVTHTVNPCDNKPSVYYGATAVSSAGNGTREADAGLQFEMMTWPGKTGEPGWAAFISANNTFVNVKVYDPNNPLGVPWRIDSGVVKANGKKWAAGSGSINSSMEFTLALAGDSGGAGTAKLNLTNVGPGTFYWNNNDPRDDTSVKPTANNPAAPWRGIVLFDTARINQSNVKRVVAMTRRRLDTVTDANGNVQQGSGQKSKFLLDGSELTCDFTAGQVRPAGAAFRAWGANDINQAGTGYDAPGDVAGTLSDPSLDQLWPYKPERTTEESNPAFSGWRGYKTSGSRTIVEFLNVNNTNSRRGPANSGVAGRYASEKVRINLRTSTRPIGDAIEWPAP